MANQTRLAPSQMPILRPVPIPTKGKGLWARFKIGLSKTRTFEFIEDWYINIPGYGLALIPKGFITDGASIPRLFWWLFSPVGLMFLPGIVHDFIYRLGFILIHCDGSFVAMKMERRDADKIFSNLGTYLNDLQVVPDVMWSMLFLFGWIVWGKNERCGNHNIFIAGEEPTDEMILKVRKCL